MGEAAAAAEQRRLQSLLQAAVQSVQWTYSLFWKYCPQQGIIVWSDGYYNGAIKTRKTVQAAATTSTEEISAEEATLQRSLQLRQLYDTLAGGSGGDHERLPSAALSPEDLTESEWFYLMCVSFSFPPGIGLPGKAYVDRHHLWLTRANKADCKLFSRAILAQSAKIQTVVCIPIMDGVVELGTTEEVEEDIGLIQRVKSLFADYQNLNYPPGPALSGHSTCNPTTSMAPSFSAAQAAAETEAEAEEEDDEEEESLDENPAEAIMQVGMSDQEISSNNIDQNIEEFDTHHYSETVSSILQHQSNRWSNLSSSSTASAFSKWFSSTTPAPSSNLLLDGASQWVLKCILFSLHAKPRREELAGANHVLAERRRREKLNDRFVVLRSMVPFVTKMDKASILGDTIDYLKQLNKRIQQLESRGNNKRKMRPVAAEETVEVSIIESEALVEISCVHEGGLLLEMMQVLAALGIQVTTVQSSIDNATFHAELRAKVRENANGRRASIMEVKKCLKHIIQHQ